MKLLASLAYVACVASVVLGDCSLIGPSVLDGKLMPASRHQFDCKTFDLDGVKIASPSDVNEFKLFGSFAAPTSCPDLTNWNCKFCKMHPQSQGTVVHSQFSHPEQGMHGYIATNVKYPAIIVAFRGTMTELDEKVDSKFWRRVISDTELLDYEGWNGNHIKAHTGFLRAWKSAKEEIIGSITELIKKHQYETVWVTGHSLGGALASIAGLVLAAHFPHIKVVLRTLEQPRVGNAEFASLYKQFPNLDYRRLVHARDLIPHTPPRILGYRHAGLEYWIPRMNGPMVKCRDMNDEDGDCSLRRHRVFVRNAHNLHVNVLGMNFGLCQ